MNHLTDEQLAQWLEGGGNPQTQSHLAGCAQCRSEAEELRDGISRYAIAMRRQADRAQSLSLGGYFAPQKAWARHRLRWAAATALALLLAAPTLWMMNKPHPQGPLVVSAPVPAQPAAALSDDELLEAVNNDLSREVPQALAPVSAITTGRNRIAAASTVAAIPSNLSAR
jgi:hypothetical protein